MTQPVIYFWAASLLILIVSLGIFLGLSYRHRQRIDALQDQVNDYSHRLIENFLQREIQTTAQRLKTAGGDSDASALEKLRQFWLEAELAALIEQGKRRSNFDIVKKKAQPILRLTQPQQPPQSKPEKKISPAAFQWNSSAAMTQLQKARTAVASQREATSKHQQDNGDKPPELAAALDSVDSNNSELLNTISRLEKELSSLQQKFNTTHQQLERMQHDAAAVDTKAATDAATRELIAEIELTYQQSVTEMNRMREINRNQRELILQLEQEMSTLRTDSVQYETSSQLVEKLKLQLRDYETCTVILEMETESLRERISELNALQSDDDSAAQENTAPLLSAPPVPNTEHRALHDALHVLAAIFTLEDINAIAAKLMEWLKAQRISAVLFIKSGSTPVWLSSETAVDDHSKQLLQSIEPRANAPLVPIDEGIILAFPICRALLYTNSELNDKSGALAQRIELVLNNVDRWLAQLQKPRSESGFDGVAMHKKLNGLLVQYDYIGEEHTHALDRLRQELKTFFAATNISPVQHQVVEAMLEDFDAQMELLNQAGSLIRTSLVTIAKSLEKPQ